MGQKFTTIAGSRYLNFLDSFEKGKRASVGEVRVWSGEKYQRTSTGWKYLGKDTGKTEPEEDYQPSPLNSKSL